MAPPRTVDYRYQGTPALEGAARVGDSAEMSGNHSLLLFADGPSIRAETTDQPARFLLVSGCPIEEPIAWRGPIVMNTEEELDAAFKEYREGTFVRND